MVRENEKIRKAARTANIPLWAVANAIGVSEPTFFVDPIVNGVKKLFGIASPRQTMKKAMKSSTLFTPWGRGS